MDCSEAVADVDYSGVVAVRKAPGGETAVGAKLAGERDEGGDLERGLNLADRVAVGRVADAEAVV